MKNPPVTQGIPEERVAAILARAAELDRTRIETIGLDAIRNAAIEAGISGSAIDLALEEYAANELGDVAPEPARPRPGTWRERIAGWWHRLKEPLALGGIAFAAGIVAGGGEAIVPLAIVVSLGMVIRAAVRARRVRRFRGYALRTVLITIGLTLGFAGSGVDDDAFVTVFISGLPALVLGFAFVKARLPERFRRRTLAEGSA